MRKISQENPAERPTFAEVLRHPWFETARQVDEAIIKNINWASDEGGAQLGMIGNSL